MKQYAKKLFSLIFLFSTATVMLHAADDNGRCGSPFIQYRSEGRDTARKLYGQTNFAIYQDDMDGNYGTFDVTIQYDQTFRGKRLAQCLFGDSLISTTTNNNCDDDCGKAILIQGSDVDNRNEKAWLAENFILPRDFSSVIRFSPRVSNILANFDFYYGLDRWVKGLYFRLYGPVVRNKSSLRPCENVIEQGTAGYDRGFFDPATLVAADDLFHQALNFFGGCTLPAYAAQSVTIQPLKFAKLSGCNLATTPTTNNNNCCDNDCDDPCGSSNHKTGFAELRGEFGWNYLQERYRFLINIQAAAPTGTRPKAEFALEPQVGNGKHWELGVGIGGAWRMWQSEDTDKSFNFIVEADITHLFRAKQTRTFDLVGKPNSRYMLAEKMGANGEQNTPALSNAGAQFQFANEYAPVANITTRKVKVSIGVQGDVVAMFNYNCRGFSWDLGYNFWGMSKSKISCPDNCPEDCPSECGIIPFTENTWALKGDASVAGFVASAGLPDVTVNLSATESKATIFAGTGADVNNKVNFTTVSAIDNGVNATAIYPGGVNTGVLSFPALAPISTSVPPIFISLSDFDIEGAETRGLSHKVFTHFSYTWTKHERWLPYLGVGFSAQFGSHCGGDDDCPTATTTNNCDSKSTSCALTNWAVFVKGGVSFH